MPSTDPNEAAIETWIETTDGFDRVEAALQQTREPDTAAAIAERAHVSESTARKHLSRLVDLGVASTTTDGRTTRYARNEDHYLMERVQELQRTHSRDELIEAIVEMKADLQTYRDRYDAESPEELVVRSDESSPAGAAAGGPGVEDADPWSDLAEWRATRQNLAVAQTALSFKRASDLANA